MEEKIQILEISRELDKDEDSDTCNERFESEYGSGRKVKHSQCDILTMTLGELNTAHSFK